jgi:hypothetical protein
MRTPPGGLRPPTSPERGGMGMIHERARVEKITGRPFLGTAAA